MHDVDAAIHESRLPGKVACSTCGLRALCVPSGIDWHELDVLDDVIDERITLARGETLFEAGDPFQSLFAVRVGMLKTVVDVEGDRKQITGFQMPGEILGLEGVVSEMHICTAIALEACEVCVIPLQAIEALSHWVPGLQRQMHRVMSREIVRENSAMLLLGGMRAEARLASFLVDLLGRMSARGLSPTEMVMPMTREEIGSYLGLTFETVSRIFSRFADSGILDVRQRRVRVLDGEALLRMANLPACR